MTENNTPQKGLRLRLILFVLGVILFLIALNVFSQAVNTLHELDRVEAERDQWQRPGEIIAALDLKDGSVVVDLGSGAGYFTLKLSDSVGDKGKVIAVDLRRLSLAFLWTRARLRHKHNARIIVGDSDNPLLGSTVVDAVLIANTYHELTDSKSILAHIFKALRPGGRLVVVDRGPETADARHEVGGAAHEIPAARVASDLAQAGFAIVSVDHNFIDRPQDHWWLVTAERPL